MRAIDHKPKVLAGIEGSAQLLGNGNMFVGWGQGGFFSEYDRRGRQIMTGALSVRSQATAPSSSPGTAPGYAPALAVGHAQVA